MAEAIRPGNILKSTVIVKPSTLTGGGKGRAPIDPGISHPSEPPTSGRRGFLKGLLGLGIAGAGTFAGFKIFNSPPESSSIPTTVPNTSPDTTTETTPATTETPTTIAERVFASPEQQVQVESVEANMDRFFNLTPDDVSAYKEETKFLPNPDGFSTVKLYPDQPLFYRLLAINLGTFPVQTGDGISAVEAFGCVSNDGTRFVGLQVISINDSQFLTQFPTHETFKAANFMDPIEEGGAFATTNSNEGSDMIVRTVQGSEGVIQGLNETIGQPIVFEYGTDVVALQTQAGVAIKPNPLMERIVDELNRSETRAQALETYSSEDLVLAGIFKEPGKIPQVILNGFSTVSDVVAGLPLNAYFTFFNNIPSVI